MGRAGNGAVQQALGVKACHLREDTLILDLLPVLQDRTNTTGTAGAVLMLHGRDGGAGLVGRTRGVGCAEGTVEQRLQGVGVDGFPVFVHGGQVIGGIAGTGQNLTGLDVHNNNGGAFRVLTVAGRAVFLHVQVRVYQHFHNLRQCFLGNHLNVIVDGGFHVVAGDGGHGFAGIGMQTVVSGHDGTVTGDFVNTLTVDAVQILFKGFLKAGLSDIRVHGVALFLVLGPVVIVHAADVTENMGGVGGVVLTDGRGFDVQTGDVQLQNGAEVFVGNVLDEGIVGQVGNAAKVKFVTHTHNGTGLFFGPVRRDAVAVTELLDQQRSGNIRVQRPVQHIVLEIVSPGGIVGIQRILKGPVFGDGEVVVVLNTQFHTLQVQIPQMIVTVVCGLDNVVVENQIVRCAVAHQNLAVPVQNIASGGTDGGDGGIDGGIVGIAVGFNDLQTEKLTRIQNQNQREQAKQDHGPESAYSFHVFPPIVPIALMSLYRGIISSQLSRPLPAKTPIRPQ